MDKALESMISNMPEKTGKSLDEWKEILAKMNFEKHGEAMKFLKEEHSVTHGFANTIVSLSKEDSQSGDDLVESQYQGKEDLKPIYYKLIEVVTNLGADVNCIPKKGSVSITRKKQFTLIKPATKSRIDLGLKLKGKPETQRLQNSGPFGTMCTHRVQIHSISEVDEELISWLREAYEVASQ